jgi:effector-binding domain-containing protein
MPLDEIREVLGAADADVATKVLDRHRWRLEGLLDRQTRMLTYLRRLIDKEGIPMLYEVTIKHVPAQHVAVLRRRTTAATIGDDVGRGFGEVGIAVGRSGAGFAGPPFLVMTEMVDADGGEVEVGFPVATPFADDGEVVGRTEPPRLVATTLHHGPYDEEGPAYQTVDAWVQEHGHTSAGLPREVYLTDPDVTPDPADYVTEIQFPIVEPA